MYFSNLMRVDAAVETLGVAYKSWTRTHQEEVRKSAAMMAKEMVRKMNGRSLDSLISEQTMNKIK